MIYIPIENCAVCPYHAITEYYSQEHQICNKANYLEKSDDKNYLFRICPFKYLRLAGTNTRLVEIPANAIQVTTVLVEDITRHGQDASLEKIRGRALNQYIGQSVDVIILPPKERVC
jgi:hypothetical protein